MAVKRMNGDNTERPRCLCERRTKRNKRPSCRSLIMQPRFVNPHLVSLPTEKTCRRDLEDNNGSSSDDEDERLLLLNNLHKRLRDSLDFVVEADTHTTRKRRKVEVERAEVKPISFKLLSKTERLISLEAPPPKPPQCYREPTYEDTSEDALKRREKCKAVAVDFDWVIQESLKPQLPFPSWNSRVMQATADSENGQSPQPLIVFQTLQQLRKTRPPVPDDLLSYYPYTAGGPLHPDSQKSRSKRIPVVDVTLSKAKR
ncbi:hypothetical protein BDP27DRAFT_1310565 [Rhodocollybia butyracea]|uniref:Uncharacterized protein n=1 Tax=Rhodocollybia butyracea TaxID=206335 RepID=A0A9P5UGW8_9AGAR|nr:hypothetical protein BDP27DRAFT_1310565 [Rhodocollybia butyracea]